MNDNTQHADKHVISPGRGPGDPRVLFACWKNCLGRFPGFSQREKPCFSLLMLLGVNGEQIVEAVSLMSVQGLDTFDLLRKQTSF